MLDGFDFEHVGVAGDAAGHAAGDNQVITAVEDEDFGCFLLSSIEEDFGGIVGISERRGDAPGESELPISLLVGGEA